jgi:hypothetical protein
VFDATAGCVTSPAVIVREPAVFNLAENDFVPATWAFRLTIQSTVRH